MRRFAILLGLTAAIAGVTAAPAAAQSITPPSYDWGTVDPKQASSQPLAEFQLQAGILPLNGTPTVVSGDATQFIVLEGFCDGSLSINQSCVFRVRVKPERPGATSAVVGIAGGPTATVSAVVTGDSPAGKGKKRGCKKGKKGAAAAKKKGCKKKGKKK